MAVESFTEIQEETYGSQTVRNGIPSRSYTRAFRVEMSDPSDNAANIFADSRCPPPGSFFVSGNGYDTTTIIQSWKPSRLKGKVWRLVCEYATPTENPESVENPLQKPAEFSGNWSKFQEVCESDIDGTPIVNSAKRKYDPPIMATRSSGTFVIKRNEPKITPYWFEYMDVVNSETVRLGGLEFEPYSLRIDDIKFSRAFFGLQEYWPHEYHLEYRTGKFFVSDDGNTEEFIGWDEMVPDMGLMQLVGGYLKPCYDKNMRPVTEPCALQSNGAQRPSDADDPQYNRYTIYEDMPFSVFHF